MTPDPSPRTTRRLTSLRSRLLAAFTAVAMAAIALVAGAAVVGADRGLTAQAAAGRRAVADRAALTAADAYRRVGTWDDADLGPVVTLASGADARVAVRALDGHLVAATTGQGMGARNGQGMGPMGPGAGAGAGSRSGDTLVRPVEVSGTTVGSVTLLFPGSTGTAGRPVAWAWVSAAAVLALGLAVVAGWLITRTLTRPLAVLTGATRAFAAGDRGARAGLDAPGELGELAAAFDDAAERVEVSERVRRQLSADVAHELRTPLAALQAGLEELRDGLVPADAAALARLHDQTLRLGRVVTDLADLSAADAARLTLRPVPVDLTTLATQAAAAYEARLRAAGVTPARVGGVPVTVVGDPERLHQVVGNLLQNCARHCRPGDAVTLDVAADPASGTASLTVRDTGPGIAPADLPHVFTRFWRSGDGQGSGLGMAVVRSLVEAHGGTVRVASDGRRGTTVTVALPLADQPAPAGKPVRTAQRP